MLKIEKLVAEINTGESSTLVFSTIAASVSFALLTGLLGRGYPVNESWFEWVWWAGFLFALLAFLYREVTIHSKEMVSYRKLPEYLKDHQDSLGVALGTWLRMILVRAFLILPIGAWLMLINQAMWSSHGTGTFIFLVFIFAFLFSLVEQVQRDP